MWGDGCSRHIGHGFRSKTRLFLARPFLLDKFSILCMRAKPSPSAHRPAPRRRGHRSPLSASGAQAGHRSHRGAPQHQCPLGRRPVGMAARRLGMATRRLDMAAGRLGRALARILLRPARARKTARWQAHVEGGQVLQAPFRAQKQRITRRSICRAKAGNRGRFRCFRAFALHAVFASF